MVMPQLSAALVVAQPLDTALLAAELRHERALAPYTLDLEWATLAAPACTVVTCQLPDELWDAFSTFDTAAARLSSAVGAPAWALTRSDRGFFSARAFDAGQQQWEELEGDGSTASRPLVRQLTRHFGPRNFARHDMTSQWPWWRLWAALATRPRRLLRFDGEAPLELAVGEAWADRGTFSLSAAERATPSGDTPAAHPSEALGLFWVELTSDLLNEATRLARGEEGLLEFEPQDVLGAARLCALGLERGALTRTDLGRHLSAKFRRSDLVVELLEKLEAQGVELRAPRKR